VSGRIVRFAGTRHAHVICTADDDDDDDAYDTTSRLGLYGATTTATTGRGTRLPARLPIRDDSPHDSLHDYTTTYPTTNTHDAHYPTDIATATSATRPN
jgi:hypothetical protein